MILFKYNDSGQSQGAMCPQSTFLFLNKYLMYLTKKYVHSKIHVTHSKIHLTQTSLSLCSSVVDESSIFTDIKASPSRPSKL